ncbi:hypothetical protein OJF2_68610 [Aquisphaera giovannonii]|uniref:Uncharacterized protein n=1 Tax=Aquisphaera giovannonii TaxID=406548 RepID=A0A5B9WCP2_9BACT|nr:hypothetical protein [Aquisphaera giovannonii]QEH38263.1 hypothetical protein OJF2_68610 [Aquisphaera giovannonii]
MSRLQIHDERGEGGRDEPDDVHLETIALLQEEVARLEAELLARDEADRGRACAGDLDDDARVEADRAAREEAGRLRSDLAARDETIKLILDQLSLVEEAEAAGRAEWEQLAAWVSEMEERVERAEAAPPPAASLELERHRREAEALRAELDRERKAWAGRRAELERELERLRGLLARAPRGEGAGGSDRPDRAAIEAMEADNRRLRERCREVEEDAAARMGSLRAAVDAARAEAEEARGQVAVIQDLRDREQREFEVAVASLRAQSSRAAAAAAAEVVRAEPAAPGGRADIEPDMRIHAFRQHLREIHEREAEDRRNSSLAARLSRLWGRTAPAR